MNTSTTTPFLSPAIPQLPSGNFEKTSSFFNQFLGFDVIGEYPDMILMKRGEAEIHFWLADDEFTAKSIGENSSCYIRVQGVDGLFEEFKAKGAPFRYELKKRPWGMMEMQIDDPFGNAIRFGESFN